MEIKCMKEDGVWLIEATSSLERECLEYLFIMFMAGTLAAIPEPLPDEYRKFLSRRQKLVSRLAPPKRAVSKRRKRKS